MKLLIIFSLLILSLLIVGCVGEFCIDKETGAKLSYAEAKEIAIAGECGDRLKEIHLCNEYTGTWWIDVDIERELCNPACVVDVNTKEAVINWRCTGVVS